jgi:hypothetical protein
MKPAVEAQSWLCYTLIVRRSSIPVIEGRSIISDRGVFSWPGEEEEGNDKGNNGWGLLEEGLARRT